MDGILTLENLTCLSFTTGGEKNALEFATKSSSDPSEARSQNLLKMAFNSHCTLRVCQSQRGDTVETVSHLQPELLAASVLNVVLTNDFPFPSPFCIA